MATLRHAQHARHPQAVDGRGAVAAEDVGRQHARCGQARQRHMLRIGLILNLVFAVALTILAQLAMMRLKV